MTLSMTAFARAEAGAAVWELRSVNHRYFEVSFRMPENLRRLEPALRALFRDRVHRGKVECSLKLDAAVLDTALKVNEKLALALHGAARQVGEIIGRPFRGDDATTLAMLQWPGLLIGEEFSSRLSDDVQAAFASAVDQLVGMRRREGGELAGLIRERLQEIETCVGGLRSAAPGIIAGLREKLLQRLDGMGVAADQDRVAQEIALLVRKLDITEELDRLMTHVAEVRRNLGAAGPVGRRLDFLMQELNREANTLASKSAAGETTHAAVELKVIIEQIREQVQNIE